MQIIRSCAAMQQWSLEKRRTGSRIGLVPTMGFLHEGHLSLLDLAHQASDATVVSIFVNPTQFGPAEDFERYPRDFDRDCRMLEARSCDAVFAPEATDMYPTGFATAVQVDRLSTGLCGAARPGHFSGVATVVSKLLNIVAPHVAVFGRKDAQQLAVIRRMVRDLDFSVEILPGEIVREPDGLAMSSRNAYLSPEERAQSSVIRRSLLQAQKLFVAGERDVARITKVIREEIAQSALARIDYVEVVDPEEMSPLTTVPPTGGLAAVAAFFGRTRLIDNHLLRN